MIRLEMPAQTRRLIERAATVSGCSLKDFVVQAAVARASALTGEPNRRRNFKAFLLGNKADLEDLDVSREKIPMRDADL